MKRILFILLLFASPAFAISQQSGIDGLLETITSDESKFSSAVGGVTGITGVHLHDIGENSCRVTRNGNVKKFDINACIIHIRGIEYRFTSYTALSPAFPADDTNVFVGYSSHTMVQQNTAFTEDQRLRIVPLARIQATKGQKGPGSDISDLGITDLRPISENFEKNVYLWVKNFNGPLVKEGFIVTENLTTTRQLDIEAGTFSDEELVSHTTGPFTAITGLVLFHTALGNWTSILDVIRLDNVNYDTATGRVPMTNNNWYAAHNLMMSPESKGRPPRFILVYSQAQYNDIGVAEATAFDFGPFENSTPRMVPLIKAIVKKNTDPIVGLQDARPINASGVGTGAFLPTSLQGAYNASPNSGIPEITTNDQHSALTIRHGGAGVNPLILETQLDGGKVTFGSYTTHVDVIFSNGSAVVFDNWTGTGETRFRLYDISTGIVKRVLFGPNDGCGAGYKCLRTAN